MKFNYINPLDVAVNSYLLSEGDRRKFTGLPELSLTAEVYDMFYDTIDVYEECLHDFFRFYGIDTDFLNYRTKFMVEQFPWIFNYCFDNGLHAFSVDVNINYSKMAVTFSTIKCKYYEGNVIYVNTIPDRYLRQLDLNNLPISTMIEHEIPSTKRAFKESVVHFTLKYEISYHLFERLAGFNTFIDTNLAGLRELLLDQ